MSYQIGNTKMKETKLASITVIIILCCVVTVNGVQCTMKCGIVEVERGGTALLTVVKDVWNLIYRTILHNGNTEISISFETLKLRTAMDWDTFVQAYMDIRTANVSAIIGPYAQPLVTSAERYSFPYFLLDTAGGQYYSPENLIQVFPSVTEVYSIVVHLVKKYKWSDVLVFYEDGDGLKLIEDLLQLHDLRVRAFKLDYKLTKWDIKRFLLKQRRIPIVNFVVLASRDLTSIVLDEALHVSMLSKKHIWIVPSLNHDLSDFTPYAYTDVNLTTFDQVQGNFNITRSPEYSKFEYAAIHDSLMTLYELTKIQLRNTGSCILNGQDNLLNNLQKVDVLGATGVLSYRGDGSRAGFTVNILNLGNKSFYKIGHWNSSLPAVGDRLILNKDVHRESSKKPIYPLGKEIINIVTILEPPFVQRKKGDHKGNDRYEGYCIDLLENIAKVVGFKYELYEVPDGHFGDPNEQGEWNGIIGEIMNGNALMTISSITITSERESVVDFAKPFKPRGLSIIMKRSEVKSTFFQFLEPLSPTVWALMAVVLVTVSFLMYIVDKMAHPDLIGTVFKPQECVWFTFASLVLNSTDIVPRSIAGKFLAAILWFFSLILITNYTANLAAFLTISKFDTPVHSVYDLAKQSKVKYGTVWDTATSSFFERSKLDYFKKMWQFMAVVEPSSMLNSSEEGIQRVKNSAGDYAFIWDDDVIRYEINKDCSLLKVGGVFDGSRGYGIAMPKNAGYREDISIAILKLTERGVLQQIEHRWWEPPSCISPDSSATRKRQSLSFDSISGIFAVLTIGVLISVLMAVADHTKRKCTNKKKKPNSNHIFEEKNNSTKSKPYLNDVNITLNGQAEECFLANSNTKAGCSKHTNIF